MIICYLLESTNLAGGVRVAFDQARLLTLKGHKVIIRAKSGNHHWYHHPIDIDYVNDLASPFLPNTPSPDIVIATFWTTVHAATQLGCRNVFHFCQGYEGDIPEYAGIRQRIEQAYRLPIPKLTVGNWLTKRLQQIYNAPDFTVHTIGQIVDTALFKPPKFVMFSRVLRRLLRRPVKILLIGMFESSVKGIPDALQAIKLVRNQNIKLHVTRVSSHPLSEQEKTITPINHYLTQLPPQTIARLYRQHDLMIAPSHIAEGFGLPFAEALASGLPCIATAIPSHMSFDNTHDYAAFVPPSNSQVMAQALLELLNNPDQQAFLRQRGPQLMQTVFSQNAAIERLEQLCQKSLNH
ncbi:MAG: glycosyltransferase family 4 protein [Burkholderiales bacterium]|nr:glycosyltransferase family 4 protein [Nitrosomonas sp.]MCP5274679.1 glycosyltransferase family 4 protein [Burkholderiales bacterium]